jgi:PAS domain S-box-containing protein
MTQEPLSPSWVPSGFQRYAIAFVSVGAAIGVGLFLFQRGIEGVQFPIFLIAIALTAWYAGVGPAVVALVVSALAFNYYFTKPYYSFYITSGDLAYYVVFILFALLIVWFSTSRRRVERNLVQSRDELQREVAIRNRQTSLLNLTNDPIFVRSLEGVITYWNYGAEKLYGWTAQQAIGKPTQELLRTVFPMPLERVQAELLRNGRWEGELTKTKADGTTVVVSSRWALQRDDQGEPVAILESENDITERKRRDDEIRRLNRELAKRATTQQAYLDELFDQTPEGLALVNVEDRVMRVNREFTRMFGYAPEEAIGQLINDLVAPEELRREADDFTQRCITRKETVRAETIRRCKDGTRIPVSLLTFPISIPGGQIAEYAIYRDLTRYKAVEGELARNRAFFDELFHQAPEGIVLLDIGDHVLQVNREFTRMFGYAPSEAVGRRINDLIAPAELRQEAERYTKQIASGSPVKAETIRRRKDGSHVHVSLIAVPVTAPDGQIAEYAIYRDLTGFKAVEVELTRQAVHMDEIRRLNRELGEHATRIEAANKELEAFAYSVSHDLRAPLRHMVGYTELLQKTSGSMLDEKGRRYMLMILDSAKRMGNLIDDLLAFSRIGRAETRETTVSLEQLVREVQSELGHETDARNVAWKVGPLPELHGDRSMLKLVLINLISNAVKFSRTRSAPQIEIGSSEKQDDGIVVFVRDNGVGFDMKYVNKLFGVFQRLHRTEEFEGTGIGLATVQRIIHRHGGRVWAEGQVDAGATFYISLPKQ